MKNKRYIIIVTKHDTDGTFYVESIMDTFTNKQKAQQCVNELIEIELSNLGNAYVKHKNKIIDKFTEYVVSEYEIHDVITEYK